MPNYKMQQGTDCHLPRRKLFEMFWTTLMRLFLQGAHRLKLNGLQTEDSDQPCYKMAEHGRLNLHCFPNLTVVSVEPNLPTAVDSCFRVCRFRTQWFRTRLCKTRMFRTMDSDLYESTRMCWQHVTCLCPMDSFNVSQLPLGNACNTGLQWIGKPKTSCNKQRRNYLFARHYMN